MDGDRAGASPGLALLGVLLAPVCAVCDRALDTLLAGPVCPTCWLQVRRVTPPACAGCGAPLSSARALTPPADRCASCRVPRPVTRARAVGPYEGALRDILHAFKYQGRRSLARPLARLMVESGAALLDGVDLAVPVPLHWTRRWRRGFNQAAALAREIGLPVLPALRRVRRTVSQVDLPADARHANVRGAFGLAPPRIVGRGGRALAGRTVVLVDDVRTTGATLDACARTLLAAGALEVRALTAARAEARRSG